MYTWRFCKVAFISFSFGLQTLHISWWVCIILCSCCRCCNPRLHSPITSSFTCTTCTCSLVLLILDEYPCCMFIIGNGMNIQDSLYLETKKVVLHLIGNSSILSNKISFSDLTIIHQGSESTANIIDNGLHWRPWSIKGADLY